MQILMIGIEKLSKKIKTIAIEQNLTFTYVLNKFNKLYQYGLPIELDFTKVFSNPAGITLLSTLINYTNQLNNKIEINYTDEDIIYLARADFFKNLGYDTEENFKRHDVISNMMECKKVVKDGDPDFIDDRLKSILRAHLIDKNNLILGILLTTYEITDNILEHCNGGTFNMGDRTVTLPGFVSAQYYGGYRNHIEIGISDSGVGIVNSLESAYPALSRQEVLMKAFELNTSRHRLIMPTRGNGLAKLKEFVLSSHGTIKCSTNEFIITFNHIHPNGFIRKRDIIIGTHFEIIIGCTQDIDTKPIFNADSTDYEDSDLDDFFEL